MFYFAHLQGIYFLVNAFISLFIGIKLFHSSVVNQNRAVRLLSYAAFAVMADWIVEGIALLFFPDNTIIATTLLVVFGQFFIQLCMSFILMVVITTTFPHINVYYGLTPTFVGLFAIALNIVQSVYYASLTFTPEGFPIVPYSPIGEFINFLMVVTVTGLFGYSYFSQTSIREISLRGILFATGVVATGISGPLTLSARSDLTFHILNIISVIGMTLVLLGVLMKGPQEKQQSEPSLIQQ